MAGDRFQTDKVTTFSFTGSIGNCICSRSKQALTGEAVGYHHNGTLFFKCHTIDGLSHGICNIWDEKGKLIDRQLYFRGIPVDTDAQFLSIKSETLTAKDILTIKNATIRQTFLEEFGYDRFLKQMPHVIIDKDGDEELVEIWWHKREEPIYLVKVRCPSVGIFYTLRVPPTVTTVKEAVAWTFGVNEEEYAPAIET